MSDPAFFASADRGNLDTRPALSAQVFFGEGEGVASDVAKHWRKLAAEARARADEMADPEAKRIMSSIAEGYERLAQRADARKNSKNPK